MKREILFRGKTCNQYNENDNGIWLEAFLSQNMDNGRVYPVITDGLMVEMEVIPETVGQFTGLCDKNGVKIFEGDVCRSSSHYENGVLVYNYHAIEWSGKYSGWFAKNTANIGKENTHGDVQMWVYLRNCEPEIIGNINDNTELLKND